MEKNKITIRLCYIELIIFAGILVTMIFHFRCGFEKSFFALMIIAHWPDAEFPLHSKIISRV